MGVDSKIQWTQATWNPWHGCKKVSQGCKFCYMYRDKERYNQDPTTVLKSKSKFKEPLKWKEPTRIFTCSWSDWFIEDADEWRPEAWEIIKETPHHTYQILTKRPERIKDCLPEDWADGYKNVWLGVSVEDQKAADIRIPILSEIPAHVAWISFEPLLSDIKLGHLPLNHDWAVIGGESGNESGKYRYRRCELGWIRGLVTKHKIMDIPVFVKQLGTALSRDLGCTDRHGGVIEEWPKRFQVREYPF